jgi:hypothetical protein
MTPTEFVAKWAGSQRTKRAAAQEHFIDLCRMLHRPTPNDVDPAREWYALGECIIVRPRPMIVLRGRPSGSSDPRLPNRALDGVDVARPAHGRGGSGDRARNVVT